RCVRFPSARFSTLVLRSDAFISGGDSMAQKRKPQQGNRQENSAHHEGAGIDRKLHDPVADRLIPLEPLDLGKISSIDDLVRAMSKTAFTGRQLGEAADVLEAMA